MPHILVIDDEDNIRFVIRLILETVGHQVMEAQDGQAALELLKTHAEVFDVIVLDLRMPHMDGIQFLSAQRGGVSAPVIVLTAHREMIPKTFIHQISSYLSKPFRKGTLLEMVNSLLRIPPSSVTQFIQST
jgi:CheY-like chemotaxis protein